MEVSFLIIKISTAAVANVDDDDEDEEEEDEDEDEEGKKKMIMKQYNLNCCKLACRMRSCIWDLQC